MTAQFARAMFAMLHRHITTVRTAVSDRIVVSGPVLVSELNAKR
ncbi:hypothetical protein [Yoonia sp. R2-816]